MRTRAHTRIPVYEPRGDLDTAVGVVHAIDLVALPAQDGDAPSFEELARPAPTTSEDALLDDLLERLREGGDRFAFVEGKEGRRTGIVTLETVLETIVGDLEDEFDRELDERR